MPVAEAPLVRSAPIADGTMAFWFERPAGFDFVAGQFANFTLLDARETDDEGDMRSFSIASAPCEDELMIATRMRDTAFKRTLASMKLGDVVEIDGPHGDCVLRGDDAGRCVFLAGGIGITPFRRIVQQAAHERRAQPRFLFYSNRRPEDAAFLDELDALARNDAALRVIATMVEMERSRKPWNGWRGVIRAEMLREVLTDPGSARYYVAGPPAMVGAMLAMLDRLRVPPASIVAEEFAGY
jgi:ferredoxin-NADP reductase